MHESSTEQNASQVRFMARYEVYLVFPQAELVYRAFGGRAQIARTEPDDQRYSHYSDASLHFVKYIALSRMLLLYPAITPDYPAEGGAAVTCRFYTVVVPPSQSTH